MKNSKLCPELIQAKKVLIHELNIFMKHGSTSEGIDIIVPSIMPALHIDYKITYNYKIGQYGCKVELMTNDQKLTLKF